jgi:hypothetical protein
LGCGYEDGKVFLANHFVIILNAAQLPALQYRCWDELKAFI